MSGQVAPPSGPCPSGCGCVWGDDADRCDCPCEGPCTSWEWLCDRPHAPASGQLALPRVMALP